MKITKTRNLAAACIEALESRRLLSTIYALTTDNKLLSFDSATPGTISTPKAVTSLQSGENLLAIDFRPTNGALYALGSTSRLYTINLSTGAATQVGTGPFIPALSGTAFGFDFNPITDVARVVSDTGQNFRLNPDTGVVTATDVALNPGTPSVVALAYSNNFTGASSTTAYDIDSGADSLLIQSPPDSGTLTSVGALGANTTAETGLDIDADGNAFASLTTPSATTTGFYTINLATGAATLVGAVGGTSVIRDISASLSGVFSFSAPTYTVAESAGTKTITINRTGGTAGPATVTLATSNGTATAGQDYTAVNTVVNFASGDTSKTVDIPITDDTVSEPSETVNLALSAPSTGASLGTQNTAVLTITDNDPASILFAVSNFSVDEGAGNAIITVTRGGDTSGAASVNFATSDGTAKAGSDYTAVNTTVNFLAGESTSTVSIPIIDDTITEPAESVNLTLSSPTGAALGTRTTATLTIIDNDAGASLQPDTVNPKRKVLVVTGTAGDDIIRILRRGGNNLEVIINGVTQGVFTHPGRVIVRALDGNDLVRVQAGTLQSMEIHGGNGDDVLIGAAGRDLLIGGAGRDVLLGRANDDILIGGTTSLDDDVTALGNLMAVWLGKGSVAKRATAIRSGTGVVGNVAFNSSTISDDSTLDVLDGDVGSDLIFNSAKDVVTDDDAKDILVVI